jgi:hypothetical protein
MAEGNGHDGFFSRQQQAVSHSGCVRGIVMRRRRGNYTSSANSMSKQIGSCNRWAFVDSSMKIRGTSDSQNCYNLNIDLENGYFVLLSTLNIAIRGLL